MVKEHYIQNKHCLPKSNITIISRLIVELSIPMPVLEYSRSTANQPYGFIAGAIYIYIYIYILLWSDKKREY